MAQEIERKFLVKELPRLADASGTLIRQGYLTQDHEKVVRIRLIGDKAILGIKAHIDDVTRLEYEYPIPTQDAHEILDRLCSGPLVEKTRHRIPRGELVWELDVFHGQNEGLVIAEVELETPDQEVPIPDWVGAEVSSDTRYLNANLARHPYRAW